MDLYNEKDNSYLQKTVIVLLELLLLCVAYWLLFLGGNTTVYHWMGLEFGEVDLVRRQVIFGFSIIVFLRICLTLFYLIKRKIPWGESLSIPFAFALYYLGFALLVCDTGKPLDAIDYFGILLFLLGSSFNTGSELHRHFWKKHPENKGKIFTIGLFRYSMHINYFGDLLWVSAYAILTRNVYAIAIPLFLFCFFAFYNIPMLDKHLASHYGQQFEEYRKRTKRFIPFIY